MTSCPPCHPAAERIERQKRVCYVILGMSRKSTDTFGFAKQKSGETAGGVPSRKGALFLIHFRVEANVHTCFLSTLDSGPPGGVPAPQQALSLHSEARDSLARV